MVMRGGIERWTGKVGEGGLCGVHPYSIVRAIFYSDI